MLELSGYKVSSWTESEQALNAFCESPRNYDLVVTDQTMPKITGIELSKKLLKIREDIPIILLSGYSESANREQALNIGIRNFLMKPILVDEFNNAIRNIIDNP